MGEGKDSPPNPAPAAPGPHLYVARVQLLHHHLPHPLQGEEFDVLGEGVPAGLGGAVSGRFWGRFGAVLGGRG